MLAAARAYGHPPEQWLDLSTGINPRGWPVGDIPPEVWRRLPEAEDGLLDVACEYYGTPHLRFGLPGAPVDWERLDAALTAWRNVDA